MRNKKLGYRSHLPNLAAKKYYDSQVANYKKMCSVVSYPTLKIWEIEKFKYANCISHCAGCTQSEFTVLYRCIINKPIGRFGFEVIHWLKNNRMADIIGSFSSFEEVELYLSTLGLSVSYKNGVRGDYNGGDFELWWNCTVTDGNEQK